MTYADLRALETLLQLGENYYVEVVPSLTVGRVFFFLKYARDFCGAMCLDDLRSRIGIIHIEVKSKEMRFRKGFDLVMSTTADVSKIPFVPNMSSKCKKNNTCHFTFTREILTQKIYFLQEYLEIMPFGKAIEKGSLLIPS